MAGPSSLVIDLDAAARARLEALASACRVSPAELTREALLQFLDVQEWQIAGIEAALAEVDAGRIASDEEVEALFERLEAPLGS